MNDLVLAGRGDLVAAAALLAHWWSRPMAAEVDCWLDAADVEAAIRQRVADGTGPGEPRPAYGADEVPALLVEYERLFVGPGPVPCPPYESYWRDDVSIDIWHSLMGPCTAELRDLYRELGIDLDPASMELPDHVAVEFEALAYALTRADGEKVAASLIRDHLSGWLPRLCRAVGEHAAHPFYQALAETTVGWLGHIQRSLAPEADVTSGTP